MIKLNVMTFCLSSSSKIDAAVEYSVMKNIQEKIVRQVLLSSLQGLSSKLIQRYKLIIDIDYAASPITVSHDININKDDLKYVQLIERSKAIKETLQNFNDNCARLPSFREAKVLYIKQLDSTDNPNYLPVSSLLEKKMLTHIQNYLPLKRYALSFSIFGGDMEYSCPRLYKQPKEYNGSDSWYGRVSLCAFENHIQFISQQEYEKREEGRKSKNTHLIDNNKHYQPCKNKLISITDNQRKELEEIFENDPSAIHSNFHLNVKISTRFAFGIAQPPSNTQLMSFKYTDDQLDF